MSALLLSLFLAQAADLPTHGPSAEGIYEIGIDLPAEGEEIDHVIGEIGIIRQLIKDKRYGEAAAAIIMLFFVSVHLVLLRFGVKVPKVWYGHLAMATGIAIGLSVELAELEVGAGVGSWVWAGIKGTMIGFTAVGAWEKIGKRLFGKLLKKAEAKGNGGPK